MQNKELPIKMGYHKHWLMVVFVVVVVTSGEVVVVVTGGVGGEVPEQ